MATWKCKECGAEKEGRCRPQKCECGASKEAFEKKEESSSDCKGCK